MWGSWGDTIQLHNIPLPPHSTSPFGSFCVSLFFSLSCLRHLGHCLASVTATRSAVPDPRTSGSTGWRRHWNPLALSCPLTLLLEHPSLSSAWSSCMERPHGGEPRSTLPQQFASQGREPSWKLIFQTLLSWCMEQRQTLPTNFSLNCRFKSK
jgi:hypothetical protein